MLTGKEKNQRKGEKKKHAFKNKKSALLIPSRHNQKSPFPLFPLKAPMSLLCWLSLKKNWLGFAYARLNCAAVGRGSGPFLFSMETLAKTPPNPV